MSEAVKVTPRLRSLLIPVVRFYRGSASAGYLQGSRRSVCRLLSRHLALRRFAPAVMALAIRAAIDEVAYRLADEHGLELAAYGRELAALFDHATAAG
jgi:hypothetical protein